MKICTINGTSTVLLFKVATESDGPPKEKRHMGKRKRYIIVTVRLILFTIFIAILVVLGIAIKMYADGYTLEDFVMGVQCSRETRAGECQRPYYTIAHMTNTPKSIELAIGRGANAIEADLWFDEYTAAPKIFTTGELESCSCKDILTTRTLPSR